MYVVGDTLGLLFGLIDSVLITEVEKHCPDEVASKRVPLLVITGLGSIPNCWP